MIQKFMNFIFIVILSINGSCSINKSIELNFTDISDLKFDIQETIGFQANLIWNDSLKIDEKIDSIKNMYELHLQEDSISIMVIQTDDDQFYVDRNVDNYISSSDSFKFDESQPMNIAIIQLNTNFPNIKALKLLRMPGQEFILVRTIEYYEGFLPIGENNYPVAMYVRPHHFSYKRNGEGINIAIDINLDNRIGSDEMTIFNKPIMISNLPILFESFTNVNEVVNLQYSITENNIAFAKNFYHPNIKMYSLIDSSVVELNSYKNKIVIINWWSPSCGPCIKEIPELNKLFNEYINNTQLIFLAINSSSNQDKIKEFLNNSDYNFQQFFVDKEKAKELNISAIPRTIVLNKTGKIIYSQIGYDVNKKLYDLRRVLSKF